MGTMMKTRTYQEKGTSVQNRKGIKSIMNLGLALLLSLLATALAGCGQTTPDPVTKQSFYFDTVVQLTIYDMEGFTNDDASRQKANAVIDGAFEVCADYENLLSKTKEGTDVWNINHAEGEPVKVNADTIEVIDKGIEYGDLSGGRFDITVGQAEDLWDFHSDDPHVPDADALAEAVQHIDYRKIEVDEAAGTVRLADPDMEIDLGGIAKGYIADKVCDYLRTQNVTSAIVSLGGNIETVGGKPDGKEQVPFRIGIETPYSNRTEISGSVELTNGTMVTSGVYERHFTVDGKDYHHILDVDTGYPVDTDVLGVTIQGSEGHSVDCDALSTTCLILGSKEGKKLIESLDGYEAAFILQNESVVATSGMKLEQ